MRMVATGLRTALLPQEGIGFEVALKADAMWVHVKSDLKDRLVAAAGEVTRMRLPSKVPAPSSCGTEA